MPEYKIESCTISRREYKISIYEKSSRNSWKCIFYIEKLCLDFKNLFCTRINVSYLFIWEGGRKGMGELGEREREQGQTLIYCFLLQRPVPLRPQSGHSQELGSQLSSPAWVTRTPDLKLFSRMFSQGKLELEAWTQHSHVGYGQPNQRLNH